MILQASEAFSHQIMDVPLDDAHIAQPVAFALLGHQILLHQLFQGMADGGLVQGQPGAQGPGGRALFLLQALHDPGLQ